MTYSHNQADFVDVLGQDPGENANPIAKPANVADLIDEYQEKLERLPAAIAAVKDAHNALQVAISVRGAFGNFSLPFWSAHEKDLRKALLVSGWQAVYKHLGIDRLASAKDKQLWERTLADPPELTLETAKATFGDYILNPRVNILRALAEAFADLDPAYKSHAKVRIGVKGLPKRVILSNWGGFYNTWGRDKFRDMANALATYQGKPHVDWLEILDIDEQHKAGSDAHLNGRPLVRHDYKTGDKEHFFSPDRGLTVRKFANGNAHVIFDQIALIDINKALAEFYGEVLPDAEPEGAKPRASTALAKDLQFYWTPEPVIARLIDKAGIYDRKGEPFTVLEPSCGDGRILDELAKLRCKTLGIEVHAGRADEARRKGHSVLTANFLDQAPAPQFDAVVMNPPFYGKHYAKHVRHALRFLKPGGVLAAVLPASARYDHTELDDLRGDWSDLPVGSFSEAGTNVPTVIFEVRA